MTKARISLANLGIVGAAASFLAAGYLVCATVRAERSKHQYWEDLRVECVRMNRYCDELAQNVGPPCRRDRDAVACKALAALEGRGAGGIAKDPAAAALHHGIACAGGELTSCEAAKKIEEAP